MQINTDNYADLITIETIDAHTGGEPLRIITKGLPLLKGTTVLEKRAYMRDNYDYLRTFLMWEPRGHADMYGAVLTEPEREDSDFGVFFIHNEGYSTMCGHAIIALTKIMLETETFSFSEDKQELRIDTPAGQVISRAKVDNGKISHINFDNVPSFIYKKDLTISVPGIGTLNYDIGFGGAFYAYLNINQIAGLTLLEKDHSKLIALGKKIKKTVMESENIIHPQDSELSFLYGVIFIGDPEDKKNHSRNVCIFADGEVDRSPTGTGVSGRAAIHYFKDGLAIGEKIDIESILGSVFSVEAVAETSFAGYPAVTPRVYGEAYITGQHKFILNPADKLQKGFIFR